MSNKFNVGDIVKMHGDNLWEIKQLTPTENYIFFHWGNASRNPPESGRWHSEDESNPYSYNEPLDGRATMWRAAKATMKAEVGDVFSIALKDEYIVSKLLDGDRFYINTIRPKDDFNIGPYTLEYMLGLGYLMRKATETTQTPLDEQKVAKTEKTEKIAKKNKKKNYKNRPLYLAASKNGMTHKGIASKLNERNVNTFGNSVLQALSKYEDRFGKKLDLKDALMFKLVPHTVRTDKKTGKPRIGSEVKI